MKKRLLATILAVVMCVGLVGCGGKGSDNKTEGDSKKVKELEVWFPATAQDGDDAGMWADVVADWEKENNAKVNFQFISWKDYEAKYSSAVSTGTGPDVGHMYVEMFPTYIDAGAVEDLSNYLTDEDYENYAVLTDKYKIFGKHYGIALSGTTGGLSLIVNKDILDSMGESMPQNWDDVLRIAQKATKDTDNDGTIDQYGIAQGWGQTFYQDLNWNWYSFLWQAGGDVFDAETGECTLDSEAGITTAQWLYDLKNKYNVLPEDTMSLTNQEAFNNYFLTGKAAMSFVMCGTSTLNLLKDAGINYEFSINLAGPNGDHGSWSGADQYVLMSAAEDKELAWSFIKYITGPVGGPKRHEKTQGASCLKDGPYFGSEETKEMMQTYGDECVRPLTAARRATEVYDYLWKAAQGMMNGQSTPEDTMKDVTTFANNLDYSAPN